MPTRFLASTVAVISVLSVIASAPLVIYIYIISQFLCDSPLQAILKEKASHEILEDSKTKTSIKSHDVPRVLLSCVDLTYTVIQSKKKVLDGVTAWFAPGTLTAVLGSSGCGKTTLLTVLAAHVDSTAEYGGKVYVNGEERLEGSSFRTTSAYVMQTDTFQDSLTVRETLWFTTELRLDPDHHDQHYKLRLVEEVIRKLGLDGGKRVGMLSGGQKRRLTVGVELVARPSLIFLDEPTTGLDASGSLRLGRVLRALADEGRTVICTIHQPRTDVFNLFDMVLLMNAGKTVYFGPAKEIMNYFSAPLSLSLDDEEEPINPADFVLDLTQGSHSAKAADLVNEFEKSNVFQNILTTIAGISSASHLNGEQTSSKGGGELLVEEETTTATGVQDVPLTSPIDHETNSGDIPNIDKAPDALRLRASSNDPLSPLDSAVDLTSTVQDGDSLSTSLNHQGVAGGAKLDSQNIEATGEEGGQPSSTQDGHKLEKIVEDAGSASSPIPQILETTLSRANPDSTEIRGKLDTLKLNCEMVGSVVTVEVPPKLANLNQASFDGDCGAYMYTPGPNFGSTSYSKQTFTLLRRQFITDIRNPSYIKTWILGIVMMLFLGLLYLWVSKPPFPIHLLPLVSVNMRLWGACTQNMTNVAVILNLTSADAANQTIWTCGQDIQSSAVLALARRSFLYQVLVAMFFSEFPLVAQCYGDKEMFRKEVASRAYSARAWISAWIIKISFAAIVKGLVYPPLVYFLAHLPIDGESYALFSIFVGTMSLAGSTCAVLSCVLFTSFEAGQVAFIFIKTVAQALCGYYISAQFMPWWFRWIYYVNFFRYTFEGAALSLDITPQVYEIAVKLNAVDTYNQVRTEAWDKALIGIFMCVAIELIAAGVIIQRNKGCSIKACCCG